jgi:hypothetical protein
MAAAVVDAVAFPLTGRLLLPPPAMRRVAAAADVCGGSGSDPPDKVRPMATSNGLASAVAALAREDKSDIEVLLCGKSYVYIKYCFNFIQFIKLRRMSPCLRNLNERIE